MTEADFWHIVGGPLTATEQKARAEWMAQFPLATSGRQDGKTFLRSFTNGEVDARRAASKDHQHMDDLTISPAPKGGYTVLSYDDDVLFAGFIGECCSFVSSHFATLAQQKRELEETSARAQRQADAERAIRDRAALEIARLKDDPGTAKLSAMADRVYGSSQDNVQRSAHLYEGDPDRNRA